ncbi:MAG: L-2-amino-thiazoline-4-carboxylic acid hydrolase [Eubacteriales bacterium]|nr:L-2-amino-thiazoline-4-carboxylic acid hydrolase [Eubacteriales bacterium]MDD3881636.1 L-2-amino-thiazoline-4-carboxylic acid hydrolase [Eubacteriales bacterium]MDD4512305.1 L-2-amino-thiazoline-4-carboxylic acid hydrolase [Eubacteriales bacterium]
MYLLFDTPFAQHFDSRQFTLEAQERISAFLIRHGFDGVKLDGFLTRYANLLNKEQLSVTGGTTSFARAQLRRVLIPTVCLYRQLQKEEFTEEQALTLTVGFLRDYVYARAIKLQNQMTHYVVRRRKKKYYLQTLLPQLTKAPFLLEIVRHTRGELTFKIRHCFYKEALERLGAPELLPYFCELNKVYYDACYYKTRFSLKNEQLKSDRPCVFSFRQRQTGGL